MKVLHVITSLQTGGAEKLMVDLLPRFNSGDIECELLTFDGTKTPFRRDLEKKGIRIHDFGDVRRSSYSIFNLIKFIPFLKRYDIVHTHNTASQLFAAIGSVFCPTVLCTTEHSTSNRRRRWKYYMAVDRWMYSRYRKVICISEKAEYNLRNYISDKSDKFITIYNGIDVGLYANAKPINLRDRFPGCKVALIQVAGFRIQKDQETVIKSLMFLPKEVHLFLVGDGERRDIIEKLIDELNLKDRVHLLGVQSNVPNLLKGADIAIMSSHWEGFGLAAVEAMAAGIPVIASNVDGLAQVVSNSGILVKPGSVNDLSIAIQSLVNDEKKYTQFSKSGLERAKEFDISKMVDGYNKVYSTLI